MSNRCSVRSLLSDLHIWCLIILKGILERKNDGLCCGYGGEGYSDVGDGKIVMLTRIM